MKKGHNIIPFETIKKILDEGRKRGNRYLEITGGEPFLHPEIIRILSYAERSGYLISILTNGLLLDEKIIQSLSTIKARLRLGFYSANKETHEYFSGEDTYDPLVNVIRILRKKRLYFGIGMPVFKKNVNEIEDTVRFAFEEGCAFVRIIPCAKYHKAENEEIDSALFEQILSTIVETIINYRDWIDLEPMVPMKIPNPIEMLTTRRCTAGCNYYHIDPEMTISPCPYLSTKIHFKLIKFNDYRDFNAMDSYMDNYFEELVDALEGACKNCEYHIVCIGGCLFEKTTRGLNPNKPQPICLKRILHHVMKKYDAKVTDDIVQAWVYSRYKDLYEDSGNRGCVRQLPIWYLNFKGRGYRTM
jgi:radical SAM protein with 4Fe4S-binding SPASM domain